MIEWGVKEAMLVNTLLNATQVRANFGGFIDDVVRVKPQFVKRNRDVITGISNDHLKLILSAYEFTFEYEQGQDGGVYGSIEQIPDIIGEGTSVAALRLDLAEQLIEYAQMYYEDFARYSNAPNRREHVPYVLRVLQYDSVEEVEKLLHG